ncbi:indole-3-glycerol phosphate synthase [Pseudoclavibacter endophyticus]|uniref:indole-3-glycerol-phosphate synthase n=1 Tax=Pseudoclavibacter endophyticus TaxID=1778590 RepID=A0A6H9WMJ9_9MICO|nr:indole-3-glycerol phosphate synthase TrpC [Pseudoclavibacter endophyticus]KAB1650106.1 indole-3-glycerol phosphate synthase TrpC [Pseudoclavibacter endophyticus]GGA57181.1 indole-3-glycerol phosphate synthase [Pseudoclavibacter endophyticus]
MLEELLRGSLEDAARRRSAVPTRVAERHALDRAPAMDAEAALRRSDRINIIGEVKRASPSRGDLANISDPSALAAAYAGAGAAAISVLTEERRFKGSLDDLRAVRDAVEVPVLRKEFIGEEYQLLEARAAGADIALLIVACLDQPLLERLHAFTRELGMTALVEAHTRDEALRAVDAGATVVGINARDLHTFELHPERFGDLAAELPSDAVRVAESAVKTPADVRRYVDAGAHAVLIGEALVTGADPAATLESFLNA